MTVTADLLELVAQRADAEGLVDVAWTAHDSPIGSLVLAATDEGLVTISYRDPDAVLDELAKKVSPRVLAHPARLDDARRQLDAYFDGTLRAFDLTLDWRLATPFQRSVLAEVQRVPFGSVASYQAVARAIGRPTASRAAGGANARNPIPIVVPCHRVVGSDGSLTGYAGGVERKAYLLDLERAQPARA
jgi:methylated-DNA-[protein]-cysteine S-methyltransferase